MLFLMQRETEDEAELISAEFKASVFANNPSLYVELFEEPKLNELDLDSEVIFPETEEEFKQMVNEMKRDAALSSAPHDEATRR